MVSIQNTKTKLGTPKITPAQLLMFAILTGWLIVSNLVEFYAVPFIWEAAITIGFYIAIMLLANQKGNIEDLVKSLIGLIVQPGTSDEKVLKLQNLLVAICQELNIHFEKEKEKFFTYLETTTGELEAIKLLRTQIAEIEAKLK